MENYITINMEYNILLCKICQAGVQPGCGIITHFRNQHQVIGQDIQIIQQDYKEGQFNDPSTSPLPDDGSLPIPGLTIYNGYSCNRCRTLTRCKKRIRQHWINTGHSDITPQYTEVKLQSWTRLHPSYWIVRISGEEDTAAPTESQLDRLITESKAEQEAEHQRRLEHGDTREGYDHDSTWVKEMKWVRHIGSRNLIEIHNATQWIRAKTKKNRAELEDEALIEETRVLTLLGESLDREVDRCSWRLGSVPKETLQCLHGIQAGKPHSKPFGYTAQDRSQKKYQAIAHRYIGFCWRAFRMGRREAEEKLAMFFTDEQWRLMGNIVDCIPAKGRVQRAASVSNSDDEDNEFTDSNNHTTCRSVDGDNFALDAAVFEFMVASIKVKIGGNMYNNALLCFCAALGIRQHPLGFTEAFLYTGMLAALLWVCRLFFLEDGFEGVPRELEQVSYEATERFQQEYNQWMCIGTYTVISKIINWMAYGKGHRNKTSGTPSVRWSKDGSSLFHNGERLLVQDFQRAACKLVMDTEHLLDELFGGLWGQIAPTIDLNRIVDSVTRVGAGQSFATNEKNAWLDVGPGKVIRANSSRLFNEIQNEWKKTNVKKWLQTFCRFTEGSMAMTHIWQGMPGRGPETSTIRHCDTAQLMRNIFVYDGQVMIVTDRDKMKAIRDNGRKVARFLTVRISRMIIALIAWLQPAELMLRRQCGLPEPEGKYYEFLWRAGSSSYWDTQKLSMIMVQLLLETAKIRITVGRYRVIAIELGRNIRGLVMKQVEGLSGEDEDDGDCVEFDPMTGEPIDVSGSWNIVWDLQSTHSTKMARLGYAVHVALPGRLQPEMIRSFQGISGLWHQFCQEGEAFCAGWKRRVVEGGADGGVGGRAKRQKRKVPTAEETEQQMVVGLRTLMGPTSTWRSAKQRESMQAILSLRGDQGAICILPTGAGKSLLFMIPAVMPDRGTSVVVVPFAALKLDLLQRGQELGVDIIEYKASRVSAREQLPRVARMVVASADTVSVDSFLAYVEALRSAGQLGTIFIDEAHTAITDTSYRRKLTELKGLCRFERPVVLLTATLPIRFEKWFREELLAQTAVMVRDRTTKLNCRYEVEEVKPAPGEVERRVVELANQISRTMTNDQKGVIYCRSIGRCKSLAEALGCDAHHGEMEREQQNEARVSWAEGRSHRWIVATTGLGTGIDIGGIVAIIHAEQPYGLVDFIQQTGRGGRRQGEVARSVIVHDGKVPYEAVGTSEIDRINRAQITWFVKSPGCRREIISTFMDGVVGEVCSDIQSAVPCDRCRPTFGEAEELEAEKGRSRWQRFHETEGRRVKMLMQWLDEVADSCAVCHINNCMVSSKGQERRRQSKHQNIGEWCKVRVEGGYERIRQKIRFGENTCCFRCKLPLDWCQESRERVGLEAGKCVYMDKVLPVVLMGLEAVKLRQWVKRKFEVDMEDIEGFFRWLGGRVQFHGTSGANIHILWEAMVEKSIYKK